MPEKLQHLHNVRNKRVKSLSFFNYFQSELKRGYLLENDEERYAARREKVYSFFKIPREMEKFLAYGFFQSADSFLFVFTFLPIRFAFAIWALLTRPIKLLLGFKKNIGRILKPAEIVDLLKGTLLIICCYAISYIDTSVFYHIIKTQSTIKLYLFFNMLEIADRLMSAFGQDTLDALFWTATEPRDRKREHFGVIFHLMVASIYVAVHSTIVLLQALTLNVAINSDNKGLLTIVISNNFIELKGAVFKKFDRNNLLQISCSDVRERFHICVLLFVVVIQTMKEYSWKGERLWILMPDCLLVLGTEVMIDWIKHAFITRFNDIPVDAYRDYTLLIASDLIMCKQKYAYSDHSDLVARRMGFIPLPLGVVIYRILSSSLKFNNIFSYLLLILGFVCLLSFRVLNGIVMLGKASQLVNSASIQRSRNESECALNKSNLSNSSTPLRERRRTQSRGHEPSQVVENLPVHTNQCSPIKKTEKNLFITNDALEVPLPSEGEEFSKGSVLNESKDSDEPTNDNLSFLGDSRSGLMANSMVNLALVGINQGVTDPQSSITQAVSPNVSVEPFEEPNSVFIFQTMSNQDLRETKDESESASLSLSFTSTKSCPNFSEPCDDITDSNSCVSNLLCDATLTCDSPNSDTTLTSDTAISELESSTPNLEFKSFFPSEIKSCEATGATTNLISNKSNSQELLSSDIVSDTPND